MATKRAQAVGDFRVVGIWNAQRDPATARVRRFAMAEDIADDMADQGAKVIIDKWVASRKSWLAIRFVGYGPNTPWAQEQAGRFKSQKGKMISSESIVESLRTLETQESGMRRAGIRADRKKESTRRRAEIDAERERDRETERLIRRAQTFQRSADSARDIAVRAAGAKASMPGGVSGRRRFQGRAGSHPFHN
ncbi:hypothetical protein AB0I93_26880 [Streptomyces sp. NPDC049967]|uniref:hypothetical protein n=1 Tax=Streptomyces sp. NPDC049967 TaxID=3155658 RepID=UPI00341CB392